MSDSNDLPKVEIWTDGSCLSNPGPGGWACKLVSGSRRKILQGGAISTTNNRMELTAVIEGLKALKKKCQVTVYSDSQYVVNAFNDHWIQSWVKNNWRTSSNKEVQNKDLWLELLDVCNKHWVTFIWVKGHAENVTNNEVDQIANSQAMIHKGKIEALENYK